MKAKLLEVSKLDANSSYIINVDVTGLYGAKKALDKLALNNFLNNLSKKLKSLGLINFLLVPVTNGKPLMTFTQINDNELEEI